jgi:hypothetical protein
MIRIQTISEFEALSQIQQNALVKAVDTGTRLRSWLARGAVPTVPVDYTPCPHCNGTGAYPKEEEARDDRDIHPSSITQCIKTLWYACAGYTEHKKPKVDAKLRLIFDLGTAFHKWIQWRYGKRGAWCHPDNYYPEVEIDPDLTTVTGEPYYPIAARYRIRGSGDGAITDYALPPIPELGGLSEEVFVRLLHEYKTINEDGYKSLTRPMDSHLQQKTPYEAALDIPITSIIYFSKNSGVFTDFTIPFHRPTWEKLAERCDKVLEYARQGTPPPWSETAAELKPYDCRTCGYFDLCQPNKRGNT